MDKLISIIIPTHNRNELLKKALKSIQDQTYQNFEVIVIDDVGNLSTKNLVEQLNDNRFTYIHNNQHQGASYSRNLGIKMAKGKYIAFLDDDDEFMPNKLEEVNKHIVQNLETDVFYHQATINMVNENIKYNTKPKFYNDQGELYKALLIKNIIGGTPMVIAKRESLIKVGLFDSSLESLEDYELWLRLARERYKFKLIEQPLTKYNYTTSKQSISKNILSNLESIQKITNKYIDDISSLSKHNLKLRDDWINRMIVHKALLNGQILLAFTTQIKYFFKTFKIKDFLIALPLLAGSKNIFKLKARFNK
jgi:glycosyltransferase involved in cell wall biosynthesis